MKLFLIVLLILTTLLAGYMVSIAMPFLLVTMSAKIFAGIFGAIFVYGATNTLCAIIENIKDHIYYLSW